MSDRARSAASRLVSTVTATTLVSGGAAAVAAASIAWPPAAWTVRIAGASGAERLDRFGDGIGDVVQLEVEEQGQPERGDAPDALRSLRGEELQPQLHAAGMVADGLAMRSGAGEVWRVDGDEDRIQCDLSCVVGWNIRRQRSDPIALHGVKPAVKRPYPCAHHQPRRHEAEQEDNQQQKRQLDVGLDVAPQVERRVRPIAAGEQGDDHRDQDPEQGLQELHGGAFKPAVR